jgi:hypothetical protein
MTLYTWSIEISSRHTQACRHTVLQRQRDCEFGEQKKETVERMNEPAFWQKQKHNSIGYARRQGMAKTLSHEELAPDQQQ